MDGNVRGLVGGGRAITARGSIREAKKNSSPERDRIVVVGGGRGRAAPNKAETSAVEEAMRQPPQTPVPPSDRQRRGVKVFKKVHVVYYLTRNGQLEHPHFMEVAHLTNQQLRLKDFIERLTLLRGKGMPSQYSWSCKRSYKNGYVWNDLADNDIIYPSEGAEYILKGSEIIHRPCAETDKLQLQKSCNLKLKLLHSLPSTAAPPPPLDPPKVEPLEQPLTEKENKRKEYIVEYCNNHNNDDDEDELDEEEKDSYGSSNTTHSRCSRGVSTDELHFLNGSDRMIQSDEDNDHSPPHTTTSSTISPKKGVGGRSSHHHTSSNQSSRRFVVAEEDEEGKGDRVPPSRNSVLLQLIACGGSVAAKGGKGIPCLKQQTSRGEGRSCGSGIRSDRPRRGAVCTAAAAEKEVVEGAAEEEELMIKYMSENPRFGNLQSVEKEYFSGSIVEAMVNCQGRAAHQAVPLLKKSSSYKEERSSAAKAGLVGIQETDKEESQARERKGAVKGRCIPNPRRKKCSTQHHSTPSSKT